MNFENPTQNNEPKIEKSKEEIKSEIKRELKDLVSAAIAETASRVSNPTKSYGERESTAKIEALLEKIDQL